VTGRQAYGVVDDVVGAIIVAVGTTCRGSAGSSRPQLLLKPVLQLRAQIHLTSFNKHCNDQQSAKITSGRHP
jgi:hypothetical protein